MFYDDVMYDPLLAICEIVSEDPRVNQTRRVLLKKHLDKAGANMEISGMPVYGTRFSELLASAIDEVLSKIVPYRKLSAAHKRAVEDGCYAITTDQAREAIANAQAKIDKEELDKPKRLLRDRLFMAKQTAEKLEKELTDPEAQRQERQATLSEVQEEIAKLQRELAEV